MKPDAFKQMMRRATLSVKLVNAGNPDLITPGQVVLPPEPEALADMQRAIALGVRPTTDEADLNQTEQAYLGWLETQGDLWIGVQCITLKLGHDCRLTMDFWALDRQGLRAIDTKAVREGESKPHIEDDAQAKIAIAARLFPWIRFLIAWRIGEVWQHREIKP